MRVDEVRRIAVIGAGLMGHGIAMEFALAGYEVVLHDVTEEKIQEALKRIRANLQMLTTVGLVSHDRAEPALNKIRSSTVLHAVASMSIWSWKPRSRICQSNNRFSANSTDSVPLVRSWRATLLA